MSNVHSPPIEKEKRVRNCEGRILEELEGLIRQTSGVSEKVARLEEKVNHLEDLIAVFFRSEEGEELRGTYSGRVGGAYKTGLRGIGEGSPPGRKGQPPGGSDSRIP